MDVETTDASSAVSTAISVPGNLEDGDGATTIEFADGVCFPVTDKMPVVSVLRRNLSHLTGMRQNRRASSFPGPLPVSLDRSRLPILFRGDVEYSVSEKTDGVRYVCMFTSVRGNPVVVLMNRALRWVVVEMRGPSHLFKGTLLDGELVFNAMHSRHELVVFDCYAVVGRRCSHQSLLTRRSHAEHVITMCNRNEQSSSATKRRSCFRLVLKPVVPMSGIRKLVQDIRGVGRPVDGLVFTPNPMAVQFGRHDALLKWKSPRDHTVEFLIRLHDVNTRPSDDNSTEYHPRPFSMQITSSCVPVRLWCSKFDTSTRKYSLMLFTSSYVTAAAMQEHNVRSIIEYDGAVVECRRCPHTGLWFPENIRDDRPFPNELRTVLATDASIDENMCVEELFQPPSVLT